MSPVWCRGCKLPVSWRNKKLCGRGRRDGLSVPPDRLWGDNPEGMRSPVGTLDVENGWQKWIWLGCRYRLNFIESHSNVGQSVGRPWKNVDWTWLNYMFHIYSIEFVEHRPLRSAVGGGAYQLTYQSWCNELEADVWNKHNVPKLCCDRVAPFYMLVTLQPGWQTDGVRGCGRSQLSYIISSRLAFGDECQAWNQSHGGEASPPICGDERVTCHMQQKNGMIRFSPCDRLKLPKNIHLSRIFGSYPNASCFFLQRGAKVFLETVDGLPRTQHLPVHSNSRSARK